MCELRMTRRGFVVLLVCAACFARPASAETLFVVETLDTSASFPSLAVDARGNPHVAYYSAGELRYAVRQGRVWSFETVDAGNVGSHCSIAIDAGGNPHIGYRDSGAQDLKYAVKLGGVWSTETVEGPQNVGEYTSIALDANGDPHLSYYDATNGDLKYAFKHNNVWTTETVDATDVVGRCTSIAIDSHGVPHISYADVTNQRIKYTSKSGGGGSWLTQVVDPSVFSDWTTSLVIDDADNPHIAYGDGFANVVKYATRVEGAWSIEFADTLGVQTSMVLDDVGNPHIAYVSRWDIGARVASRSESGWSVSQVGDAGIVVSLGSNTSIGLDPQGNPMVAFFYNSSDQRVEFADAAIHLESPVGGERWSAGGEETVTWTGRGPIDILCSPDGGVSFVTLLSSVSGGTAVVRVPVWSTELARVEIVRSAPYSTSESPELFTIEPSAQFPWWTTTVDATGSVGANGSLALDGIGNPHISYIDGSSGAIEYAVKSGANWTTETVDASWTFSSSTSLALDLQDNPHVSYHDNFNHDLKYAVKTGVLWSIDLVDTTGRVGETSSLALDAQGDPHISYYDFTNNDLKYAYKSGGSWTLEVVDGAVYGGKYTSLALDAFGNAHIAYYDLGYGDLKYAAESDGTWSIETVDADGIVGFYTSLALDAAGNPCITYYDGTNQDLKYAAKANGAWTIEIIDALGMVGTYSSLRIDDRGRRHVGYFDGTNLDLKHAVKRGISWVTETVDAPGSVGPYASLALDRQGVPHISYYDQANFDLKYASAAIEVAEPVTGSTWPVGATRTVTWDGEGAVDVSLSVDGGVVYAPLASNISGGAYALTVPHWPSHFCKIKLERTIEANTFATHYYPYSLSMTDSLFTIETSVSLLSMLAAPAKTGAGNLVTWRTDPGPEDLDGYKLEKENDGWLVLASGIRETTYYDRDGRDGDRYRLFAVNGLGEEFYMGEASSGGEVPAMASPLEAWPLPFRSGALTIQFATVSAPGGGIAPARVAIYDVGGRLVRRITEGRYPAGVQRTTWDGRDATGRLVASGVYFLQAATGGVRHTRKVVVVR